MTCGRADAVINTMHNTPFTDMNDSEGEVQVAGYAAFHSGARVLDLLAALISAVSINGERVAENIDAACITVTELADTLVRRENLSFRQAHEIAAATARAVIAAGKPLGEGFEAFSKAFRELTRRDSTLDPAAYGEAVSARHFVAVRERFGGPGPEAMNEALQTYRATLTRLSEQQAADLDRAEKAGAALDAAFGALLQE